MNHRELAERNFEAGYNCAQSVLLAFSDLTGLEDKTALAISSSFGAGMGRLREVCGAVSGMYMVLGTLYGYDNSDDNARKKQLYQDVQMLAEQFRQENGSIICREILKNPASDPNPSPRTAEYYQKRPCARMVMTAARLMDAYIAAHPLVAK